MIHIGDRLVDLDNYRNSVDLPFTLKRGQTSMAYSATYQKA